ncbi:MAG: efflux RND transporter periplasmic adaptor subunit [Proteobacteria bacterium]|nr:efflux RND transporter periplasmic adaptor subunit [Pseudomonadota bacterium]
MKPNVLATLAFGGLLAVSAGWFLTHGAGVAAAEEEVKGSVLVETHPAQLGVIADTLTVYGAAVPAINGGMTLSVPAEGRIMRISVTPGESVHKGQSLLEFQLSAAASSAHTQAVTALKAATEEQARITRLLGQQLATRDQKVVADKAAADAQSALTALEHETGGRAQQSLMAPFDGIVTAIPVAQGERVAAGAALVTLTRHNGLVVTCGIEPGELKRVKLGQSVRIKPLSGEGEAIEGKLARIDKSLNPKTRLIDADIAVADELIQGQAYRAQIEVGELKGWIVPRDAVLDDDEGSYVFQVAGDKAKRVKVKRIGNDDENAAVDGPLDPKLEVVTVGNYQLEDGGAVRKEEDEGKDDKADAKGEKADAKDDKAETKDAKADAKDAKAAPVKKADGKQP